MSKPLTDLDFQKTAASLRCEVAALRAVAEVESKGKGFLASGEPVILYEPHIFARYTDQKYNRSHPDLSYKSWRPGAYGPGGVHQHRKLQRAAELNRAAALMACSWGMFQIMGFNWKVCGYATLQAFVNDMFHSEAGHLRAFVGYVNGRHLDDELRRLDWPGFAFGYNGAGYAQNKYDTKMAAAYKRHKAGAA